MSHEVKWLAKGMIYDNLGTANAAEKEDIPIPESDNGIKMKHGHVFGMPIDARLAIHYIRTLWNAIFDQKLLLVHQKAINLKTSLFANFLPTKSEVKYEDQIDKFALLEKLLDENIQYSALVENWLVRLLDSSFAITMDKSIILKTLSQPECEGLRFYLCMKDKPHGGKDASGNPEQIITLTTVGVDKWGKDLHFEYKPNLHDRKDRGKIPNVENFSLCDEYPFAAGKEFDQDIDADELKPYVLYKYARLDQHTKTATGPSGTKS